MKTLFATHLMGLMAIVGMLSAAVLVPQQEAEAAQPAPAGITVPVSGTLDGAGTFVGTLNVTRFASQGGNLVAIGTITGTITDILGNETQVPSTSVTLPVSDASGTCDILYLELGPLDLDLLGLVVHLDQVVLDITAESGPGNLLGNLLCAVAGLLDGGLDTNIIARLLNQILAILG